MTATTGLSTTDRNQLVHEIERHPNHPLRRLTAREISEARGILEAAGLVTVDTRFVHIGLDEPDKKQVRAFESDPAGHPVDRRVRLYILDRASGQGSRITVSLTDERIIENTPVDAERDGQVALLDEEFEIADKLVAADEGWCAALRRRGIDPGKVRGVPLSAGHFGFPDEVGKRMARVVGFCQEDEKDLPWAHPIDGLVAYVDLIGQQVQKIVDDVDMPVPQERGEWDAAPHASAQRNTLKPLEITQPDGPSFQIADDVLTWENWAMRIGFDGREGLILNQVSFLDQGRRRPVLYRGSVAEMVVFYADPSPSRFYQNYFDTGEYMFCRYTNSLKLGCDCLGEIHYLDATIADDHGRPVTIANAICIHEEDYGLLWKHNDMFNGMAESRRSRRLVVSFFTTIGNYDYGFYWYFYLDGTIELEAKATGVVFTSALPDGDSPHANEVAPGLGAPFHQHMFCARLDMAVDGDVNAVDEVDAARVPKGPGNPHGNAFTRTITRLRTEAEGQRAGDTSVGRVWRITNPDSRNRLGNPVGYALHSQNAPLMLADDDSSTHRRATFATKHLWVTRYDVEERYPAGEYVYQNPGGAGLPAWMAADRPIDGEDIVLWHTFGLTHFPRPEDWPVMPMDYAGFKLKADGFFDRNPTLDVPPSKAGTACCEK